jgi:hypothetical protein
MAEAGLSWTSENILHTARTHRTNFRLMELLVLSFNIIHTNLARNIFFSYSLRLVILRQLLGTEHQVSHPNKLHKY